MGTGKIGSGERVGQINYDVEIAFVVFPDAVVGRFVFADQLRLEHEGFELGVTEGVLDPVPCHDGGLFGVQLGVLGVTSQPGSQIDGFADVEQSIS